MRIDQLLPNFSYGDAIGTHTMALRDTLAGWGFTTEIFANMWHHRLAGQCRFFEEYLSVDHPDNILFYHYSIGSHVTGFFSRLRCRKVMIYHNITPESFFKGINRRAESECRRGRDELGLLSGCVELALADSAFNQSELAALGYGRTGVLPIFIPFEDYQRQPDGRLLRELRRDEADIILHVGRLAPNKKIEDLIKMFFFYRRIRPRSRLILVGTAVNMENYLEALQELAGRLNIEGAVFAGHVSFGELLAYYQAATAYVTMSEHEGFCVPLVEAMLIGVPIVAYGAAAVPDTLAGAGLIFREKDFALVAETVAAVATNDSIRNRLTAEGRRRAADFDKPHRESMLKSHLATLGVTISV